MPKRGLIALAIVWAVLLLVPAFKTQSRQMVSSPFSSGFDPMDLSSKLISDDEFKRAHPGDPQLAMMDLHADGDPKSAQYWRDWDALAAKFPDDLNVRRARLIESARIGSKLVRPIYAAVSVGKMPTVADVAASESWQNAEQRAAMARAARVGAQQAPNDSFFPWMEAMALWNRDDEAALQALERAAKTSDFDDGVMANARAVVKLREEQYGAEGIGKLAIVAATLLPHYAPMRALAREVTASGVAHYRRGDKAGAYRRWRAMLRAGGAFRRGESHGPQSILIGLLVAQATQSVVWTNVARELNPPARVGGKTPTPAESLRAFEQLARRDGQGQLAAYAARESAAFEGRKLGINLDSVTDMAGLTSPGSQAITQLPRTGGMVFWLSLVGVLSLTVCLIWRRRTGGARWYRASLAQIAFFGGLWAGLLTVLTWAYAAAQAQEFMTTGNIDQLPLWMRDAFNNWWLFWIAIAATLAISIALCYWQSAREKRRLQAQILPLDKSAPATSGLPVLALGIAWLALLLAMIYWAVFAGNDSESAFMTLVGIAIALMMATTWAIERGANPNKTRARLWLAGAICALMALGLNLQFGLENSDIAFYLAALDWLLALGISLYLAATSKVWRAGFGGALAVGLQTLGGVALVCSVALLLASLAALPIRARQNRVVDDYIARGEIDWLRAQMASPGAAGRVR